MKLTFEEEFRSIIAKARFGTTINRYEEMPEYIQKEIDAAVKDALIAHQAEASPLPPEGCICGSFWTVRQAHKGDCPLVKPVDSKVHDSVGLRPVDGELQIWHSEEVEAGVKQIVKLCNQPILGRSIERDREVENAVRGIIDAAVAEGIAQSTAHLQAAVREAQQKLVNAAYIDQDEIYFRTQRGFIEQYALLQQLKQEDLQ